MVFHWWHGVIQLTEITWSFHKHMYQFYAELHFPHFLRVKIIIAYQTCEKKVITFFINVLLSTDFSKLFRVATFFFPSKVWLYDHSLHVFVIGFLCLLVQYIQCRNLKKRLKTTCFHITPSRYNLAYFLPGEGWVKQPSWNGSHDGIIANAASQLNTSLVEILLLSSI